jgi:NADPH:quinone reductase-like Zn-dependent oxidoreductase
MKALRFTRFGGFSELIVVEMPVPVPGPDEVLVRIKAASINPSDTKNVHGKMPDTTLPRTPGRDFAGIVVQGSAELLGEEVWGAGGDIGFTRDGSHAEYIVLPRSGVRLKPKRLSMVEAASVGVNFVTAWVGLVDSAHVVHGETVIVTGASGGVGSAVVQIAKWKGATVIAVDRHAPGLETTRQLGIDMVLGSESDDVVARVKEFTAGQGADIVFDCVGGPLFETGLASLGQQGRQINITSVVDRRVSFDLPDFYHRRLTLYGVDTRALDTVAMAAVLDDLAAGFENGMLHPARIARTCSLHEAQEAYASVDSGSATGKVVFIFDE